MEDPTYSMLTNELGRGASDEGSNTLDPTLTDFSPLTTKHSQSNSMTSMANMMDPYSNFPQPDVFSPSYLSNLPTFNPNELFNDLPRSSHDDLNQFFNDTAFSGGTPCVSDLAKFSLGGETSPLPAVVTQNWLRNMQQLTSVPNWEDQSQSQERDNGNSALAVDTKLDAEQRETVIKNGQATPGDSPSSPKSTKGARKTTRKSKAGAKLEAAAPTTTSSDQAPIPAKRARKPRRSNKKKPTPEEEAAKRVTFLKRNREAAYKCRIKKKNQTEGIVERAKMLDADNAMKGLEVERLRREIESLRALLLPHWRGCGDRNVASYVDNLVNSGWGLGKMVLGAVTRPKFEVEDEPREDDGRNEEGSHSHPRDEDGENENGEPAHKRRRSEAVFEIPMESFEESINQQAVDRQRRESFFGNSLAPEEILRDALGSQRGSVGSIVSLSSSGAATPAVRAAFMGARGMDILSEFLVGDTPPPLDLSAPDGDGN